MHFSCPSRHRSRELKKEKSGELMRSPSLSVKVKPTDVSDVIFTLLVLFFLSRYSQQHQSVGSMAEWTRGENPAVEIQTSLVRESYGAKEERSQGNN